MNILMIGRSDPAGMMIAFANGLNRYSDHTARVITFEAPKEPTYDIDILVSQCLEKEDFGEIEWLLKNSDIIHFHMLIDENVMIGPLCVRDYMHGKTIIHHHHGHQDFFINAQTFADKYRRLNRRSIVSTPDLLKLLPDATWQPNFVPLFDVSYLPRRDHLGDETLVRIVQAPTRKWQKQTSEFRRVTQELCDEFPFVEALILEDMTLRQCLKFKRSCHISFDHMNGWFGLVSLESLAQGIPTLAGLDEWNIQQILEFTKADDVPWVLTRTEDELREKMRQLILDPAMRVSIGDASRQFMEKHWKEQQVLKVLLDTYESL